MANAYDSGLLVGRFQHFHIGHESLVDAGLKLCDRMLVFVGSAQECGTERNPFNIATRIKTIKSIYDNSNRVMVYALSDLTNEHDVTPDWGKYVLKHVDLVLHKAPELMIYGNDESRSRWFDVNDIKNTSEFIVNRAKINISGTKLREMMVFDKRKEWMEWVNPRLHKYYDELRGELMSILYYQELFKSHFT